MAEKKNEELVTVEVELPHWLAVKVDEFFRSAMH